MQKYKILILTYLLLSCGGTKNLTELSNLTIENRKANHLIIDRKPDYGLTRRGGCLEMGVISMDISKFSETSITGKVFDSNSKEPLSNARLTLFLEINQKTENIVLSADQNGFFQSNIYGKLFRIDVAYIAYRNLILDFKKI